MFKSFRYVSRDRGFEIEDSLLTSTQGDEAKIERPAERRFLSLIWWVVLATIVSLGFRTGYLSVARGEYYREMAHDNRIRSLAIKAPRGKVYDRFGKLLVQNIPSIDAVIIPIDLPDNLDERMAVAQRIASILKISVDETNQKIASADRDLINPILLKEHISQEESLIITEKSQEIPGVRIENTAIRQYVDSTIFAHILGYEGKIEQAEYQKNSDYLLTDSIGKMGLEKSYEKYLRGVHGAHQIEVDSLGSVKKELGVIDPVAGSDIFLSVDAELQKKMFDVLSDAMGKAGSNTAAAVAISPKDGKVLGLVSLPSFDNNLFSNGITREDYARLTTDQNQPMFNRAIGGEYPPGSTIKPLVAVAGLAEKVISEQTTVESLGGIEVGGTFFGDWKVNGVTDVRRALAVSSDVFFYALGGGYGNVSGLGMSRMKKYENYFGLGSQLGIDLPGEATGFIPDEEWKQKTLGEKWYTGNSYHAAIGQGFVTTTPLQIANYIAGVANGGTVFRPQLVSYIKKADGEVITNNPQILGDHIAEPSIFKAVREGMRMTITEGTAQYLKALSVEVAGKTGTAQFGKKEDKKTHSWFASFAPFENPEIAMVVLLDSGGESTEAVHVTKDILEWYFARDQR